MSVGSAAFSDVLELARLLTEGFYEPLQPLHQLIAQVERGDPDRVRDDVVGALGHVDMVVRVNRTILAEGGSQDLVRPVRQHLVHVHVPGGPSTRLEDVQGELVLVSPGDDLVRRPPDCLTQLVIQEAELVVGKGCRFLDLSEGLDELPVDPETRYREVVKGSPREDAIESLRRYADHP